MSEPIYDQNQKRSEATMGGLLRLGCCHCDRDDFDGVVGECEQRLAEQHASAEKTVGSVV